jgi:glycine betaine/choline ABC-type transport system substrate-binding protein
VMSSSTLRVRLGIAEKSYSMVSRLIADAKKLGVIKPSEAQNTYIPFWA